MSSSYNNFDNKFFEFINNQFQDIKENELKNDLILWEALVKTNIIKDDIIECIKFCMDNKIRNLEKIFRIYLTRAPTSASAERSFSSLRIIKTWLRSTTSDERLNILGFIYINKDIMILSQEIIKELNKEKKDNTQF
jgi:hypothetical protein